ncbi:MAG: hypothetical protein ACXWB9_09390 [Flavisolibacter sp.]
MEFQATVTGEHYHFSALNQRQYLVSGDKAQYILYLKDQQWRCADELEFKLLQRFQYEIEERERSPF